MLFRSQDIAGAHVRVRWTVADEDRHEVDRALIERELGCAAGVKLEGRIVPVVRTRAAGISRAGSLADKVRQWARVTEAKPEPLLECLAQLEAETGEVIAERVLRGEMPQARESASKSAGASMLACDALGANRRTTTRADSSPLSR